MSSTKRNEVRITLNSRGSGIWRPRPDAKRVAAFTWLVRSRSELSEWYHVYVDHSGEESAIRCQCMFYLFNGHCAHAELVLDLEERYAKRRPVVYAEELVRKVAHPRPTMRPYPR